MNSFYLKLIYDYVKSGNKKAATKVASGPGLAPVVVEGIYYPDIAFKAKMDLAKKENKHVLEALLSKNLTEPSGNSEVNTCYDLFFHIWSKQSIWLSVAEEKNGVNAISVINSKDLNNIITALMSTTTDPNVAQEFHKTL